MSCPSKLIYKRNYLPTVYRTTDNLYTVETLEVPPALVTTLKEKLNSSCIQDNQLAFLIAKQLL